LEDRRRDGGTNFILGIKEQGTRLTLHEHDDNDGYMHQTIRCYIPAEKSYRSQL
jgi:hypothetical protein